MANTSWKFCMRVVVMINIIITCNGHTIASKQMEKKKRDLTIAAKMDNTCKINLPPSANWEEMMGELIKESLMQSDYKLTMAPYTNCEKYLLRVPKSIEVLGELVFLSSKDDFSINKNTPEGGFKFLRYPNSFRASLMQVCNGGWHAFSAAHNSMDQIKMHTTNMPHHITTAVEIILMEDNTLMEIMLPSILETLKDIANSCLSLAQQTKDKFQGVVNLVQELIEVSTDAQQAYNQDLNKANNIIAEYKIRQKQRDEATKRAEKDLVEYKERCDKAEKVYEEAMKSMPSGWDVINLNLAEGLAESLDFFVAGLFNKVLTDKPSEPQTNQNQNQGPAPADNSFDVKDVYRNAFVIATLVERLKTYFKDDKIYFANLYDQIENKSRSDSDKNIFEEFKSKTTILNQCEPKAKALELFDKAISICNELGNIAPKGECDPGKEKQIAKDIEDLLIKAQAFNFEGKQETNTNPLPVNSPPSKGKTTAGQYEQEKARFQISEAKINLENAWTMYNKAFDRLENDRNDLTDILTTLASANVQEIDFKTTLEFLALGLQALGKVQEQWQQMVMFFHSVLNIIEASMHSNTKSFVEGVEQGVKVLKASSSENLAKFVKLKMYKQALQVSNVANLVRMISTTYFTVSDQYLMGQISSLGRLMALEVGTPTFQRERETLRNGCNSAELAIKELSVKNKNELKREFEERVNCLCDLQKKLPSPTKEQEEKAKKILNNHQTLSVPCRFNLQKNQ